MTHTPRSILKQTRTPSPLSVSVPPSVEQHAVHFPPSPCITKTFEMYSSSMYDRSPIVVGPNNCALPARGCPGRTYYKVDDEEQDELELCTRFLQLAESRESRRGHAHPRALAAVDDHHPIPMLIPDFSTTSESEESDGFISPAPERTCSISYRNDTCTALFPPEPPSHPSLLKSLEQSPTYQIESLATAKPRPIRPKTRRPRSRSSSPPKCDDELEEDSGYVEDNEHHTTPTRASPSPSSSSPKGCKLSALRAQICKTLSFETERSADEDGCLGGF